MAAGTGETLVGRITHYYSHLNVGIIELTDGDLNAGDTIHIQGKHTDFTQTVDSLQIEHQNVTHADKGVLFLRRHSKTSKRRLAAGKTRFHGRSFG